MLSFLKRYKSVKSQPYTLTMDLESLGYLNLCYLVCKAEPMLDKIAAADQNCNKEIMFFREWVSSNFSPAIIKFSGESFAEYLSKVDTVTINAQEAIITALNGFCIHYLGQMSEDGDRLRWAYYAGQTESDDIEMKVGILHALHESAAIAARINTKIFRYLSSSQIPIEITIDELLFLLDLADQGICQSDNFDIETLSVLEEYQHCKFTLVLKSEPQEFISFISMLKSLAAKGEPLINKIHQEFSANSQKDKFYRMKLNALHVNVCNVLNMH